MSTVRMFQKQYANNKRKYEYQRNICLQKSLPIQESWTGEINEASRRFSQYIDELINTEKDCEKRALLRDSDGNHNVRITYKDISLGMVEGNIVLNPYSLKKELKPSFSVLQMSPIVSNSTCNYQSQGSNALTSDIGSPSNQTTLVTVDSINTNKNSSMCELAGNGDTSNEIPLPTYNNMAFACSQDTSIGMQQIRKGMCLAAGSNDSAQIAAYHYGIFNRRRTNNRIVRYKRYFKDTSRIDPEIPYNDPYEKLLQTLNTAIKKKRAQQSLREAPT
jgi:hypothetical protein